MSGNLNNRDKVSIAWGPNAPAWVGLLADACDRSNQREVADAIGKSSGYVSRLINRSYAGSYAEAEQIVRAAFGDEEVMCPLYGRIGLKTCIKYRRRERPMNGEQARCARVCPGCPNNTDRPTDEED